MNDIFNISKEEAREYLQEQGCTAYLQEGLDEELSPQWDDLARLYSLLRKRKPFKILEFGSGFSTLVMAYALKKNWDDYMDLLLQNGNKKSEPKFAKPHLVALESSKKWKDNSVRKVKEAGLNEFVKIKYSEVEIDEHYGQICHYYKELPDIVPDFVYLDGPDPATVTGKINGLSFQNLRRTVMSGDILKYESTLLPGFFMIVDGRSSNCRFLNRMLQRTYDFNYHEKADVSTFELKEDRLGRKNIFGWEAYNNKEVYFAGKKIN
jgi:hypothetical protein